jgi:hypothetical protein
MGLSKDSMKLLDAASRGAFLHLFASKARISLIELVERLPALAFMLNSPRKRTHFPNKKRKF